jgi:hypothetical protein
MSSNKFAKRGPMPAFTHKSKLTPSQTVQAGLDQPPSALLAYPSASKLSFALQSVDLLSLQRTVGNHIVQRILSGRPSWTNKSSRHAEATRLQRFKDLDKEYATVTAISDDDKNYWLPRFQNVQYILNDKTTVEKHLATLATYMGEKGVNVSTALAAHEKGVWTDTRPILTDFVPAPAFIKLVASGQLFEDLVGLSHGVQTHRIQWYIIRMTLGPKEAMEVYRESVNSRWKMGKDNMWDKIVDDVSLVASEFTTPDRLEDFLIEKVGLVTDNLKNLSDDVKKGHEAQPTRKNDMYKLYPPESMLTKNLKNAIKPDEKTLNAIEEEKKKPNSQKRSTRLEKLGQKLRQIRESIMFEQVTYNKMTWTGWIPLKGSQAESKGYTGTSYFVPSVAYPEGQSPEDSVKL